jgi:hypothetical protein
MFGATEAELNANVAVAAVARWRSLTARKLIGSGWLRAAVQESRRPSSARRRKTHLACFLQNAFRRTLSHHRWGGGDSKTKISMKSVREG